MSKSLTATSTIRALPPSHERVRKWSCTGCDQAIESTGAQLAEKWPPFPVTEACNHELLRAPPTLCPEGHEAEDLVNHIGIVCVPCMKLYSYQEYLEGEQARQRHEQPA